MASRLAPAEHRRRSTGTGHKLSRKQSEQAAPLVGREVSGGVVVGDIVAGQRMEDSLVSANIAPIRNTKPEP